MLAFLVQRISQAFLVMFVISVIAFAIQDGLGDPLQEMVGMSVSEEEREAIREEVGLNDPMVVQYLRFAGNALQGDLGNSYFYSKPTLEVIAEHLPATLELVIGASLIIVFLSVPIGVYAAIRPQAWLSKFFMGVSTVGISIPVFLTAIVLIQLLSIGVTVNWFPSDTGWGQWLNDFFSTEGGLPSYGRGDELTHLFGTWESGFFTGTGLMHLVLPSVSLASIMLPLFIRLSRAEMMEVLQSDYVRYARAKGLSAGRINFLHALKNTMLPVITVGGGVCAAAGARRSLRSGADQHYEFRAAPGGHERCRSGISPGHRRPGPGSAVHHSVRRPGVVNDRLWGGGSAGVSGYSFRPAGRLSGRQGGCGADAHCRCAAVVLHPDGCHHRGRCHSWAWACRKPSRPSGR
ncbi:ABC transporter permease [Marinobacter manganoxydans]|uniref:Binding-protein-dependent transport systems inner membrane component n=2 Tax=Marinobacter TaxID=2742 RepID=G6YNM9_9GAMM|nr:ABC transporter permease [Marinobacter manganoxydans]EHJ06194.1 binding-protein-dependent transport systems inner membrane component [Marinobacter manganoxydans MnI7-9]